MDKLRLVQTCGAYPEQYEVYQGEDLVGYMRLRRGYFRTECFGEPVYGAETKGVGIFYDEKERRLHLNRGCEAIIERMTRYNEQDDDFEDLYTME
jgi:hypothetical protein